MLPEAEVLKQSQTAMKQWQGLWEKNAAINGKIYKESGNILNHQLFRGTGKLGVIVALGESFEKHIEILKKYEIERKAGKVDYDIICVDKCLGYLDKAGISRECSRGACYIGNAL